MYVLFFFPRGKDPFLNRGVFLIHCSGQIKQPLDRLCHFAHGLPETQPYDFCSQRCRYVQCLLVLMGETFHVYMKKPYLKGNQSAINYIYRIESIQIPLMFDTVHCSLL